MESPQHPEASTPPLTPAELAARLEAATAIMESLLEDRGQLAEIDEPLRRRFLTAAGRVSRPTKGEKIRLNRARRRKVAKESRDRDQALLDLTQIRQLRANPIFKTPRARDLRSEGEPAAAAEGINPEAELAAVLEAQAAEGEAGSAAPQAAAAQPSPPIGEVENERICYVCRVRYREVHYFYDQMCRACGDFNFSKRSPSADLSGRVALVTGARVKIGYQAAIMLLRAGCKTIVLTRFPKDAARRYAAEPDFEAWGERLEIHGIDLRNPVRVEALCATLLRTQTRLDFVINNACQTVRRPPGFYDHLLSGESDPQALPSEAQRVLALPSTEAASANSLNSAQMTQLELIEEDAARGESLFPAGRYDADLQQVDLRKVNSWRLRAHEVPTVELLEVHLVNAVAPYLLNARLKPLMLAVPTADKHVVNVSAMEGQFYRILKSDKHPHTNMAKASLNMLTRTAALDYIQDGIHMNSVDTGWVTDEDPVHHAERKREQHRFHPPLDIVDGAARIVDPIFDGIATGNHVWGQFLKDYKPTDW